MNMDMLWKVQSTPSMMTWVFSVDSCIVPERAEVAWSKTSFSPSTVHIGSNCYEIRLILWASCPELCKIPSRVLSMSFINDSLLLSVRSGSCITAEFQLPKHIAIQDHYTLTLIDNHGPVTIYSFFWEYYFFSFYFYKLSCSVENVRGSSAVLPALENLFPCFPWDSRVQ